MTVKVRPIADGVWGVSVDGRLDQNATPGLEETLSRLLDEGASGLVIDLSETTYINSGGLRCLVSAWRRAQRQDSGIVLCGLNPRLKEIFGMVGFDRVFLIYDSYREASQHRFG